MIQRARFWAAIIWFALPVTAQAQRTPVPLEIACSQPGECARYQQELLYSDTRYTWTLTWSIESMDQVSMDLRYVAEFYEFPPKVGALPVSRQETLEADQSILWAPPRPGMFYAAVRSCRVDVPQGETPNAMIGGTTPALCSTMAVSIDPASTSPDAPRGFVFVVTLATPTGGGVN